MGLLGKGRGHETSIEEKKRKKALQNYYQQQTTQVSPFSLDWIHAKRKIEDEVIQFLVKPNYFTIGEWVDAIDMDELWDEEQYELLFGPVWTHPLLSIMPR